MKGHAHRNTILTNKNQNSVFVFAFLLLHAFRAPTPSHSLSLPSSQSSWEQNRYIDYDVSDRLLTALQGRSPLTGELLAPESDRDNLKPKLLNLETDFYDDRTGLCSEGVWHNALVGIASLENKQNHASDWETIADSLFRYSWDGTSFRRRSWSGNWDHSALIKKKNRQQEECSEDDSSGVAEHLPHQANYYRESSEHRCVQHGIALVFWSKIVLRTSKEDDFDNTGLFGNEEQEEEQQQLIADCFVREFYDSSVKRWTTVSKSQGGGGIRRLSASAASKTLGLPEDAEDTPYYRVVDQAIAVLACLEQIRVLDNNSNSNTITQTQTGNSIDIDIDVANQRAAMVDLVRTTCADILSPEGGFGYGGDDITNAKSYLGLDRNRNFWHDGWTFLALLKARDYAWPVSDSETETDPSAATGGSNGGEAQLKSMWKGLEEMYDCSDSDGIATGTIWHWPKELKGGDNDGDDSATSNNNVRYCGDNALAHAIRRNLDNTESREDGFWNFIAGLTIGHEAGLSSVADVYPQVRLHPNTELSALLVWP